MESVFDEKKFRGGWEKGGQQAPTLLYAALSHIGKVFFYKKSRACHHE